MRGLEISATGRDCGLAEIGTCGDLRYTFRDDGFTSFRGYFHPSGKLVAAETTTDVVGPVCRGRHTYGIDIDCELKAKRAYCGSAVTNGR